MAEAAPQSAGAPAEKKEEKKEKSSTPEFSQFMSEVVAVIVAAYIVLVIIQRYSVSGAFSWDAFIQAVMSSVVGPAIQKIVIVYILIANILSLFFISVMFYALVRVRQFQRIWRAQVYPDVTEEVVVEQKNERWQRIIAHIGSDNPSDWRLAVLEADIILDDLLNDQGYVGDTIGDKLKKAHRGDFRTLDQAWEAHRIRNAIAHEGQDFVLTQREARRILGLYEEVFREFNYI